MTSDAVSKGSVPPAGVEPQRDRRILRWYRRPGSIVLLGAVLAIILVSCGGGSGPGSDTSASDDLAPDFSLTLYQGEGELGAETLNLSDLRGRPLVLNFWAGLCPPCRAELPDLQRFNDDFKDRVTLIGIDIGQFTALGNQRDALNLLSDLGITYPNGFTDDASVVRQYEVLNMPSTFFIDSKGAIFKKWSGALNESTLVEQTTRMLSQETGASS